MIRALRALILGIVLLLVTPSVSMAADCQFVLGFKAIRNLIGHDIVGECLENEHYNAIGDSVQHTTTGGLLVWRKADNWTAFTDGYRTWINGPNGLQQRLNTERFEWEADYAEITGRTVGTAMTRDALRNAEYMTRLLSPSATVFSGADVRLQDGLYESVSKIEYPDGTARDQPISLELKDDARFFAFGDINGDGLGDAAVIMHVYQGGNSLYSYLTAVLNEGGVPKHVASRFLGLKFGLDSIGIENGIVTLRTLELAPDDPNCCPTLEVIRTFRLTGGELQLLSEVSPNAVPTPTPLPVFQVQCPDGESEQAKYRTNLLKNMPGYLADYHVARHKLQFRTMTWACEYYMALGYTITEEFAVLYRTNVKYHYDGLEDSHKPRYLVWCAIEEDLLGNEEALNDFRRLLRYRNEGAAFTEWFEYSFAGCRKAFAGKVAPSP